MSGAGPPPADNVAFPRFPTYLSRSTMSPEPFIQPRFDGPRFEAHTLPVTAAKDLAAYEELVLELAKHLYREKHPERKNVPKRFAEGFSLHLRTIDEGSAMPALVAMLAATGTLGLETPLPVELEEARDLINRVIATEDGEPFPPEFPNNFYSYFNRIGRSLEEGERIEWSPGSAGNKAALTPVKRKRLLLAHRETYEAEVEVVGLVEELDSKKSTGVLRALTNEAITLSYDDPFFGDLKSALGEDRVAVRISGVGVFDVNERLTALKEMEQIEILPNFRITREIDQLAQLADGWLEGGGKAPKASNLEWLAGEMADYFPSIDYPSVVPTEEGNVVFEWIRPQARIELEVNFADDLLELYATDLAKDDFREETFPKGDWTPAFGKVTGLLGA